MPPLSGSSISPTNKFVLHVVTSVGESTDEKCSYQCGGEER